MNFLQLHVNWAKPESHTKIPLHYPSPPDAGLALLAADAWDEDGTLIAYSGPHSYACEHVVVA